MITFELIDENTYQFNDKTLSADELATKIKDGTIKNILKLDADYNKSINFSTKIDLSTSPSEQPLFNIQTIYFGAPGTGKSFKITQKIKQFYPDYNEKQNNIKNIFRTTIHSEYSYYDFIGNILPVSKNNIIEYKFIPGIFTNALYKSYTTNAPIFLVLEEISRGNIASIFGDLFQLLDRDEHGNSDYSINHTLICDYILNNMKEKNISLCPDIINSLNNSTIYLPKNLHILGSVNTSDQNVFVMDTAFKRRFQMKYTSLDVVKDSKNSEPINNTAISIGNLASDWCTFFPILNKYIVEIMEHSEDKQIGQFFLKFKYESSFDFSNCDDDQKNRIKEHIKKWNREQYTDKLLLYLWQDIEKSSFQNKKLFANEIKSFSILLEKSINSTQQIFSDDFINFFHNNN